MANESWLGRKAIALLIITLIGGCYRWLTAEAPPVVAIDSTPIECNLSWHQRDARC